MKHLLSLIVLASLLSAGSISNSLQNKIYEVGDKILPFTLEDQADKKMWLDDQTQTIFITYDKESTALQDRFIEHKGGSDFLKKTQTLLIVDVSVIPFAIRSIFVLPKLKTIPFTLLLSYEEAFSKMFPYKDYHIAIMKVKKRIVTDIIYCQDEACLESVYK